MMKALLWCSMLHFDIYREINSQKLNLTLFMTEADNI